jgi:hypothetical protein
MILTFLGEKRAGRKKGQEEKKGRKRNEKKGEHSVTLFAGTESARARAQARTQVPIPANGEQ